MPITPLVQHVLSLLCSPFFSFAIMTWEYDNEEVAKGRVGQRRARSRAVILRGHFERALRESSQALHIRFDPPVSPPPPESPTALVPPIKINTNTVTIITATRVLTLLSISIPLTNPHPSPHHHPSLDQQHLTITFTLSTLPFPFPHNHPTPFTTTPPVNTTPPLPSPMSLGIFACFFSLPCLQPWEEEGSSIRVSKGSGE